MILVTLLIVIFAFALAFLITVGSFLFYNKKSGKKYSTIAFVAAIFVIAFIIRFICICTVARWDFTYESFAQGIFDSLEIIYVTGGGLTFEGQNVDNLGLPFVCTAFYYGSILWLAATYIFIISIGYNYELNSKLNLFLYRNNYFRIFDAFKRKKVQEANGRYFKEEIFIFTSISEDSLILARSIEEHSKLKNRKPPLIVFAGYNIPPYDKDNDLHREVMMNGYIYQSFYKAKINEGEKPLLTLLKFHKSKNSPIDSLYGRRINIFSLGNDKQDIGLESQNSDITFNDINAFLDMEFSQEKIDKYIKKRLADNEVSAKKLILKDIIKRNVEYELNRNPKAEINAPGLIYLKYYVLSSSSINNEFYDKKITEILRKFFVYEDEDLLNQYILIKGKDVEIVKEKTSSSIHEFFKIMFQTKVINEAYLSGADLVNKRKEVQIESIRNDANSYLNTKQRRYRYSINRVKNLLNAEGEPEDGKAIPIEEFIKNKEPDLSEDKYDQYYIDNIETLNKENNETAFRAFILGFGQTGQMALNNLYVNTASVEPEFVMRNNHEIQTERYVPSRFIAHIFDMNIYKQLGVFTQTHPSYLVKKVDGKGTKFHNLDNLLKFYQTDYPNRFPEIDELIKFPFIYGYEMNCKDMSFLEKIDEITGNVNKQNKNKTFGKINAIVIALGSDEENINVANAIIQNIRQELYHDDPYIYQANHKFSKDEASIIIELLNSQKEVKLSSVISNRIYVVYDGVNELPTCKLNELISTAINRTDEIKLISSRQYLHQTIFVNVRDEKNLSRLKWRDEIEKDKHYGVFVKTFGSREDIYSYDAIIEEKQAIQFQNMYRSVDEYFNKIDAFSLETSQVVDYMLNPDTQKEIIDIIQRINSDKRESKKSYLNLIAYKKESNIYASQFSSYYENFLDVMTLDNLDKELFKYLALLEHNRWARYCISIGYIYSSTFANLYKPYKKKTGNEFDIYRTFGFDDPMNYAKGFLKLHTDLVPYSYGDRNYLAKIAEIYDYANALFPYLRKKKNK